MTMEERKLTSKLFGSLGEQLLVLRPTVKGPAAKHGDGVDETGAGDTAATDASNGVGAPDVIAGASFTREHSQTERKGAWEDPDDVGTIVNVAKRARLRKLREDEGEAELDGKKFQQRVRTQHKRIHRRTDWADLETPGLLGNKLTDRDTEEKSLGLNRLLREGGALVTDDDGIASSGRVLPQGTLEATRVRDANAAEPSNAVIRSVQFHANGSLLLTAGLDKSLRLFEVDGTNNPKVQGIFFDDLPIHKACFSGDGAKVIVAGRRKYFYLHDLEGGTVERVSPLISRAENSLESFVTTPTCAENQLIAFLGGDGHVPLVSLKSKSCVGSVKMNGSVRSATFSASGTHLLTGGGDGTVYVWDLRNQRRCVERIVDDGALTVSSLATSPCGTRMSTGSNSGIVNVYDCSGSSGWSSGNIEKCISQRKNSVTLQGLQRETRRKPIRALMNLTTAVDTMTFNCDGQMLAVSSRLKRDSLRLVHVPSCTVFSNWPSSKTPLHYVWSTAFSPTGGYLAVGNARGRALLYRIHAYNL